MSTLKGQIVKDITGVRIGSLVVIGKDKTTNKNYWVCKCDCGNIKSIFRGHLTAKRIDSCGCDTLKKRRNNLKTHGETNTRLFKIWMGMRNRCFNKNTVFYKHYGGRGIKICDEWVKSFETFRDWALKSDYRDNLSIDRIDVNGNYEPSNCRWTTDRIQSLNRRNNHHITFNNETHTVVEWNEILGFPKGLITNRLRYGWPIERIMKTPVDTIHQKCRLGKKAKQ